MNKSQFLNPFTKLRDTWLPSLGLSLNTVGSPIVETKPYRTSAEFKVNVSVDSNVMGGNCGYDCSDQSEVNNRINTLTEKGCSGQSEVLNNKLQHILDNNNLLKLYRTGRFPINDYSFRCLITCNNCNGHGTVACKKCGGSGTQEEVYQAHVRDEIIYQNGREVSRYPIYEPRHRTISCHSCGRSGQETCDTCSGDGVNTYKKTASFYSTYENSMVYWTTFAKLPWVCKFIKNSSSERLKIDDAVDWQYSNQVIQENGAPGFYKVELPGTLTGAQCKVEAQSPHTEPTEGYCKSLGGLPYDTDYLFDKHICWSQSKNKEIPKTGESLSPFLRNQLVEDCVRDMNNPYPPSGDISYLNMVRSDTVKSLQWLMNKVFEMNKSQRDSTSIWELLLSTFFFGVLLAAIFIGFNSFEYSYKTINFGLYPMIANAVEVVVILYDRSISQIYGYVDFEMWVYLMLAFAPAMVLMKTFGSNKAITVKRMLKWYVFGSIILCAFFMQFFDYEKELLNVSANNVLIDFFLISFLGGILWARKRSFGRQKQYAKTYNSRRLMELLGYAEQK